LGDSQNIRGGDILELNGIKNRWPDVKLIVYVNRKILPNQYTVGKGGLSRIKFPVNIRLDALSEEWADFEVSEGEGVFGITFRKGGLAMLHLFNKNKYLLGRSVPIMSWRMLVDEEWLKWKMLAER